MDSIRYQGESFWFFLHDDYNDYPHDYWNGSSVEQIVTNCEH